MSKYGKLKVTTYKSLLTGKRTMLVASYGKCGHENYREAQVTYSNGTWSYSLTDGYNCLGDGSSSRGIKSLLNILEGKLCPTPWYTK